MIRKVAVSVLLLLLWVGLSYAQPKTTMAVMDLNCAGLSQSDGLILTNALLSNIVNTGSFDVVERSKRDEILQEQGFAQSGACDDNACLVQFGKFLSVQKMVGGSIGKLGQTWTVNIRLLDVRTGKIDKAFMKSYRGEIDALLNQMRDIAREIAKAGSPSAVQSQPVKTEVVRASTDESYRTKLRLPILTYSALACGVVASGLTYYYYSGTTKAYDNYLGATTDADIAKYTDEFQDKNKMAGLLSYVSGGVFAVAVASFFLREKVYVEQSGIIPSVDLAIAPRTVPSGELGRVTLTWRFQP